MDTTIIVCAFPGTGKTYFARHVDNSVAVIDLDYGHFRTHYLKDLRTWKELQTPLRLADVCEDSIIRWPILRHRYPTTLLYYDHIFTQFLKKVAAMDIDVILTNTPHVMGSVPDAEYWLVTPRSYDVWLSIMSQRRREMKRDGVSLAKLDRHDAFVNTINQSVIDSWHDNIPPDLHYRTYRVDEPHIWQRELIDRLHECNKGRTMSNL